ncbi:MAG: DUF3784 domain-containing protein [Methanoregulaceae archaeon]|jgi:UDP-N-acetylmuramyl pentapeptide phosphotransferase/UDP-N-acetylglucosamine-1-phosphate transferase|nr:DUF3784 domain-containing protein [Methanoregulaceae archaeon]
MASVLILIILEFFMVLFLALGYLIRFRGRIDFVAGYREGRVIDAKGLERVVGNSLLVLGILAAVTLSLVIIFPENEVILFLIFAGVVVPVTGILSVLGSRRYLKK